MCRADSDRPGNPGIRMMRFCVIGAGSMGSLYGGLLARGGFDVTLIDVWQEHVDAIRQDGLHLDGITGDLRIPMRATSRPADVPPVDCAIILTDANSTRDAAETARRVLGPTGFALTLQNGIGNVEALDEALGTGRVMGGTSNHSAAIQGPGHVTHTHAAPTWIGELDGRSTARLRETEQALSKAGFTPLVVDNVLAHIWNKFVLNCGINAISAVTGLRLGELVRTPPVDELQTHVIEEVLAVVRAKGVALTDPDPMRTIKDHCWKKYNKPSTLQHVEQGKRTEIDALNGALVREARRLGIPTPYNDALTLLLKGVEKHHAQTVRGPAIDYGRLEAEAATEHH
jgi:2-dehydropantoate 2-reductase